MTPKSLIEPARHAGTALLRSQSDARLVDLTRDGNERAFEAIVQRYRRPLLRYCGRLLSPQRAEDAVQQAFLSAHRSIHAGDAELNLRPWLYRIAHNAALNLLRQHGYDHEQVSEEIDGVETPPQAFERHERLRTVVAAVQELPERQRSAIVLQAVEGRSYDEIASELGVSDGAVRQLLNRARNTLRDAAAAITPTGLLTRFAATGGDGSVAERVAQVVAGTGGGALVLKTGTALIVAGALTGGAVTGSLPGTGSPRHAAAAHGTAASNASAKAVAAGSSSPAAVLGVHRENVGLTTGGGGGHGSAGAVHGPNLGSGPGSRSVRGHDGGGSTTGHGGERSGSSGDGGSSSGGDGSGSDHSGDGSSGSGDHSSSGVTSNSGSDHSGDGSSGSGSGSGDGTSGSGSDSSGSDSSGSGSDGSAPATAVAPPAIPTGTSSSGKDSGGETSGSGGSGDSSPDDPPSS
jgi:RNA polymerase sigma factor (sigma-70 family)